MILNEFIERVHSQSTFFNKKPVILLIGKRKVKADDSAKLTDLERLLAEIMGSNQFLGE